MQINITSTKKFKTFFAVGIVSILLSSCSSYRNTADNDGIYNSGTEYVSETEYDNQYDKNDYYQQYFRTKASQMEELPEEDLIFTDIEAYTTTETMDEDGYVVIEDNYNEGYGAWGTNGGNITVNVYDNGWGNTYWGWNRPWGYWGYSHWGWGNPYWGWNSPYWGAGFYGWNAWGWNYGWYNPWYYSPYYGGYYYPYNNYHN